MKKIKVAPHHFTISVKDLNETIIWYRDNLGFRLIKKAYKESANAHVALINLDGFFVEIIEKKDSSSLPSFYKSTDDNLAVQGMKYFAFSVKNVDQAYRHLRSKGVVFLGEPVVGSLNHKYAIFIDNNSIPIEIFEPSEYGESLKSSFIKFLKNLFKLSTK